jgi:hypothetical protein
MAAVTRERKELRLPGDVRPLRYVVDLDLDLDACTCT